MCGKQTFCILCPARPPKCVAPPPKMVPPYSLGICLPTSPKTVWSPVALSSRKKSIFWRHFFFWQISRTALESPKIDICQNWPRRVLGDVISCLESKFDKKIPMGSVLNCRKESPNRYGIRWFKCTLKPPKKVVRFENISNLKRYIGLLQVSVFNMTFSISYLLIWYNIILDWIS